MSPRTPSPAEHVEHVEDLEEDPTDVSVAPGVHEGDLVDGRYRVRRELGRGGMSVVFLAEHVELGRPVALKILRPPRSGRGLVDFGNWFKREARTLAGIQHPNVVTLHDFGRLDDGDFFLVMEYVDGPSLSRILRQHGPLEPREALQLFVQVCRALHHTHKRGIVHLDIKPSNLLVTTDVDGTPLVKVIDFGLAEGGAVVEADDDVLAGSPHCMAPEQIEGRLTGPPTDIYALGVVMYRTITGRWPFHGTTPRDTLLAHLVNDPPPLAEAAPGLAVPEGLEAVLRRCLARAAEDRYPDAASLLADLSRILELEGVEISQGLAAPSVSGVHTPPRPAPPAPAAPEPEPVPAAEPTRRSPLPAIAGGLAVLGLLAGAGWWLLSGDGSEPAATAGPEAAAAAAPVVAPEPPSAGGSAEAPSPEPAAPPETREVSRSERPSGGTAAPPRPAPAPAPARPAAQRTPEKPPAPPEKAPTRAAPPDEPSPTPPQGYKAMPDF